MSDRIPKIASLPPVGITGRPSRPYGWLKVLLPGLAGSVMALVVLWPYLRQTIYQTTAQHLQLELKGDISSNAAIRPIYQGTDSSGQSYILKADEGHEISPNIYSFNNPSLVYHLTSGEQINISANEGAYHHQEKKVYLKNNVRFVHSLGYDLTTDHAMVDIEKDLISSDAGVSGKTPTGTIQGKGFQVRDRGNRVILDKPKIVEGKP